jgi:hypothetical protein
VVAFGGTHFFVAWEDLSGGTSNINGAVIDAGGSVLATDRPVSNADGWQLSPVLGFDGTHIFAVWQDDGQGEFDLRGVRVHPADGAVVDAAPIALDASARPQLQSAVAFDGTNYLFAWLDRGNGSRHTIVGARLNPGGVLLDPAGISISTTTYPKALRDVTGNDFSTGGTPDIYRGGIDFTTNPWPALEFQVRRSPDPASGDAFFVAERAAGASPTVFNDHNVFRFDLENAGPAAQLTSNLGGGPLPSAKVIAHLTVSPDGRTIAWAQRAGTAPTSSEDVFVVPAAGGTPRQLSLSNPAGQTVCDGSIHFTGGPVHGVAWSTGTGSISLPFEDSVAQWSLTTGQNGPLHLSGFPAPTPPRIVMVLGASARNP